MEKSFKLVYKHDREGKKSLTLLEGQLKTIDEFTIQYSCSLELKDDYAYLIYNFNKKNEHYVKGLEAYTGIKQTGDIALFYAGSDYFEQRKVLYKYHIDIYKEIMKNEIFRKIIIDGINNCADNISKMRLVFYEYDRYSKEYNIGRIKKDKIPTFKSLKERYENEYENNYKKRTKSSDIFIENSKFVTEENYADNNPDSFISNKWLNDELSCDETNENIKKFVLTSNYQR